MKTKLTLLYTALLLTCYSVKAQNIFPSTGAAGIGTTTPDASSLLEIKSTTKGFLPPRMTLVQRNAISAPAKGLLIFQTDNTPGLYYYNGTAWAAVSKSAANLSLSNLSTTTSINADLLPNADNTKSLGSSTRRYKDVNLYNLKFADGTVQTTAVTASGSSPWATSGSNIYNTNSGNVGIGTLSPAAKLDVKGDALINGVSIGRGNSNNVFNTTLGYLALSSITTGYYNTAVGFNSLSSNTSGSVNTALGYQCLDRNLTGNGNTAIGYQSLALNTTGNYNVANGFAVLYNNVSGSYNVGNGFQALYSDSSGSFNIANGFEALQLNTSGSNNIANGEQALYENTTGNSNVAIGANALYNNTTASNLVAVGDSALYNSYGNSTGSTAIGSKALYSNTTGSNNTANGYHTLYSNTTGSNNTASGSYALQSNTSGIYNTAFGASALNTNSTGIYNTAIGFNAYPIDGTINNYTGIGFNVGSSSSASNMVEIGDEGVTVIRGAVNFSTYSDGRIKNNIKNNVPGLAFINLLKPVTYKIDLAKEAAIVYQDKKLKDDVKSEYPQKHDIEKELKTGFIAQEVEAAAKQLNYDFSGVVKPQNEHDLYSLRYAEFVVPLVKAVQELSTANDAKDARIDTLQKQINDLKLLVLSIQQKQQQCSPCSAAVQNATTSDITLTDGTSLLQNVPNPFKQATSIEYSLPQTFTNAQIIITDKNGKTLLIKEVSGSGKGRLNVDASTLASGAYQYSLMIDKKIVATKQMLLAK